MELLGKVVLALDVGDALAREVVTSLAKEGAAISLASREQGDIVEDTANRIRKRRGKVSLIRLGKEGYGTRIVRQTMAEFGKLDAILAFSRIDEGTGTDAGAWSGFITAEWQRVVELLNGVRGLRHPAGGRLIGVVGILTSAGDSPLVGVWEGLWRGIGISLVPGRTGVAVAFTGLAVAGIPADADADRFREGVARAAALLVSDQGEPLRGQTIRFSPAGR